MDPPGDPKILYFLSFLSLAVAIGPSWHQEGVQSAPRPQFFKNFVPFRGRFLKDFRIFLKALQRHNKERNKHTNNHNNRRNKEKSNEDKNTEVDLPRPESRSDVDPAAAPKTLKIEGPREFAMARGPGYPRSKHRSTNLRASKN